ncbi:MAG: tetratricopeptide repeat protein [Beijerinckiaceae bacterium]|jgi:tetratricopeptide (TPR) repeat protein|nr:tetratricopeptide repeat protein [Beijerinckiaceae bacterium]
MTDSPNNRLRQNALRALALASALAFVPVALAAPTGGGTRRIEALGASGNFIAGIVANAGRDLKSAADYFTEALRSDPRNAELLDQAFVANLVDGRLTDAFRLAERLAQRDRDNSLAHVALGVRALKAKDFQRARQSFDRAGGNERRTDLTVSLLRAWTLVGSGDLDAALRTVDRFSDPELRPFRDFFGGLMADVGKRFPEAEKRLKSAHESDPASLRFADAYARLLARRGRTAEAQTVYRLWRERNPGQPFLDAPSLALFAGEKLQPLAADVGEGVAEVFYSLGSLGSAARDPLTALVYMQFAHFLADDDELITMTVAEFYEQLRQNQRAADTYARIPPSSVFGNRAAIGRAAALERLEKTDEAIEALKALLALHPEDIEAADTLGSIYRVKKNWPASIAVYDAAITATKTIEQKHWVLFFGRAIGYERAKQWAKAEPDFLKALELLPPRPRNQRERAERANVLNYLAYSWVDMHMNIDRSFEMLREAVSLSPQDGAIVDSLGWAFYRLGRYEDAVRELERAVLLRAGDVTINDHLGDAYWRVGRRREAMFKWQQALDLNPDAEERASLLKKLENGLEDVSASVNPAPTPKPDGG